MQVKPNDFFRLKRALLNGQNIESVQWPDDYEGHPAKIYLHLSTDEPIEIKLGEEQ